MALTANPSGSYNIGMLIAQLGLNDAQFNKGMKAAMVSMEAADKATKKTSASINASMEKAGKAMEKAGKKMTMFVTLPILAAGAAAFKTQKDFEKSMSKIEGLVGIAREQVQAWEKDILALGPAVGRGPKELADALFFITSAGIRGAEALDVLEMSAKASVAGLGETKVIADLVTSAMNAYGKENLSASLATDILVASVREGKAEADALAGSMGKVLPIAAEMGVTFDQVGAATAAMTRTGTTADIAATQLKAVLSSLLKPTDRAAEALAQMGTSAGDLRKMIREQGLIQTLDHLRQLTNQYGEEAMANVFPNIRALMGVLDLMGKNAEGNIEIFNQLTSATGSLDKAFEAASQTTQAKWDKAVASIQSTFVKFGTTLKGSIIPIIEKVTEVVTNVGNRWEALNEQQQQAILRVVALTAAIGPLLIIMGKLAKLIATNPYLALATAVLAVTMAVVAWAAASSNLTAEQKALNTVRERSNMLISEQQSKVQTLMQIAKDENAELGRRRKAIEDLNRISPEYFGNLSTENINTQEAAKSLEAYNDELERSSRIKAAEEVLTELNKKIIDLKLSGEATRTGFQKLGDLIIEFGGGMGLSGAQASAATHALSVYNQQLRDLTAQRDAVLQMVTTLSNIPSPDPAGGGGGGSGGGGGGGGEEAATGVSNMTVSFREMNNAVRESIEIIPQYTDITDEAALATWNERNAREKANSELIAAIQYYNELIIVSARWAESGFLVGSIFNSIADVIGKANEQAAQWVSSIGNIISKTIALVSVIQKVVAAKKAEALGNAIAEGAKMPFPLNLLAIGAGVAEVIVAFTQLPKLADGGLAYGSTVAQIGEYPGASTNPEVIAPLNKLKTLMAPSAQDGVIVAETDVRGSDLHLVFRRYNRTLERAGKQ